MLFINSVICLFSGTLGLFIGLVVIAFFILDERKVLGYSQVRKGPNKVSLIGLLQSFADLIKLLCKDKNYFFRSRSYLSLVGVFLLVWLVVFYSLIYGGYYSFVYDEVSLLWFLVVTSLCGYSLLCAGWGSYSSYAFLASIRSSFGSVSFEVCFMCVAIYCALCYNSYSLVAYHNCSWSAFIISPVVYVVFLISVFCETNRIPFDYAESESEFVSGFNLEYSSIYFTCLFACEYVIIFVFSWVGSVIMIGGNSFLSWCFMVFHLVVVLWARATLPRMRYDFFVNLFWKYYIVVLTFSLLIIVN